MEETSSELKTFTKLTFKLVLTTNRSILAIASMLVLSLIKLVGIIEKKVIINMSVGKRKETVNPMDFGMLMNVSQPLILKESTMKGILKDTTLPNPEDLLSNSGFIKTDFYHAQWSERKRSLVL